MLVPAEEKLGKARFAVYGKNAYPDATFTLRLSYGTVDGYPYNGTVAPPFTTYYGLFDRSASFGNKEPFNLTGKESAAGQAGSGDAARFCVHGRYYRRQFGFAGDRPRGPDCGADL